MQQTQIFLSRFNPWVFLQTVCLHCGMHRRAGLKLLETSIMAFVKTVSIIKDVLFLDF